MLSFSYNVTAAPLTGVDCEPRRTIDGAFKDCIENTWLSQLYLRAVTPGVNMTCPSLTAYAIGCEKNQRKCQAEDNNIEKHKPWELAPLSFITQDELDGGRHGALEGMEQIDPSSVDYIKVADVAGSLEESDYYRSQLNEFRDMREYLFLEKDIDIAACMTQAVDNNTTAISTLRNLIKEFKGLDEIIKTLLSKSNWLEDITKIQSEPITDEEDDLLSGFDYAF